MVQQLNDNTKRRPGVTTEQESIVISLGAYAVGDTLGGLIEFDVHSAGGGGRLTDFYLEDVGNQSASMTLYFYDQKPTVIADNVAWEAAQVLADIQAKIKTQALATYEIINSIGKVHIEGIAQDFEASEGKLYLYAVMGQIKTYPATTNISMSIGCLLN